jgi:hypothetical protein
LWPDGVHQTSQPDTVALSLHFGESAAFLTEHPKAFGPRHALYIDLQGGLSIERGVTGPRRRMTKGPLE